MDDADRAKHVEQADRKRAMAIARAKAEREDEERPLMIDGLAHCRDCEQPIPAARLAVRPNAARCIACKEIRERRQHGI